MFRERLTVKNTENIKLTAEIENLPCLMTFISKFALRHGMTVEKISEIQLVLEEAFLNICLYAYPGGTGEVEVNCSIESDRAVIEIVDTGIPFNIMAQGSPDVTADIQERNIGGLGCLLIRKLTDMAVSRREDGKNILTLASRL